MQPFGWTSIVLGFSVASLISVRGFRKQSLSQSGAVTAWFVGFLNVGCGVRSGFLVLVFYQIGSWATKYRHEVKERLDASVAGSSSSSSSVRGPAQVLCCSVVATLCSLVHAVVCGAERVVDFAASPLESALTCGVVAHYACCCADTLASELGMVNNNDHEWSSVVVLITKPWRRVPRGTNGGVSGWGCVCSVLGGLCIGLAWVGLDALGGLGGGDDYYRKCGFGAVCGLIGSLLDSILGATLQCTFYDTDKKRVFSDKATMMTESTSYYHVTGLDILTNAQVNLVSVFITTILGGIVFGPIIFQ